MSRCRPGGGTSRCRLGGGTSRCHPGGGTSRHHSGGGTSRCYPGGGTSRRHPGGGTSRRHPGGGTSSEQISPYVEFTNFKKNACSGRLTMTFSIALYTICDQYCLAFVMFRRSNMSMHALARLFTTDFIVNDCCVFDWLGALVIK